MFCSIFNKPQSFSHFYPTVIHKSTCKGSSFPALRCQKTNAIGNIHTETYREKQHIFSPLSFVLSSRLAFAWIIMAGVNRFADRSVAAYTTVQLLFKLTNAVVTERGVKMSEWLTLRDRQRENV